MGTRHIHADVIHAWAEGEEVEYLSLNTGEWRNWKDSSCPTFAGTIEWRIKPKIIKKEGWVNVYQSYDSTKLGRTGYVFPTEEKAYAEAYMSNKKVACVRIEWEEEE